ncbi:GNAT family N-acetyltransferase [uncultured Shimia sp.]|uniref:GNAT family N-acetyltransferase n=1 Tax=uncultured Shimia sp. TaxID=573152 RepID=UPI0025F6DC10|nr:GNAT family N-acetyltransferase [uncultured Shimia sp.]
MTEAQTKTLADGTLVLRRTIAGVPLAMLPRATVEKETLAGLVREAGLRRDVLVINPDHPAPWLGDLGAVPVMTPTQVAELDLTGDLRGQMHQKWRNRLVFAEGQGLRLTRQNLPYKPDNWILQQDAQQQATRGYATWSEALTLAYSKANRGSAKLFMAFDGKEPVAAMLFLRHGDSATYHISHTTEAGRAASAHNLLLWEGMSWLASKGVTTLELGQVDTEKAAGLARFKLGTGATLRPLGGSWIWWPPLGKLLSPLKYLDRALMAAR